MRLYEITACMSEQRILNVTSVTEEATKNNDKHERSPFKPLCYMASI